MLMILLKNWLSLFQNPMSSPKDMKRKFLPDSKNFAQNQHEVVSFDAKNLFSPINTDRVISEIWIIIYRNPAKYFTDKDENDRPLLFPVRSKLRKLMHSVFTSYNIFECQLGIYKQCSGIAMGSSKY